MAKRNYKIHVDFGITGRSTKRFVEVLDTGAGPSFIKRDVLPNGINHLLRKSTSTTKIVDTNERQVEVDGFIELSVNIGGRIESVRFNVVPRLAVDVIIGCDFCDKHIEAIRPGSVSSSSTMELQFRLYEGHTSVHLDQSHYQTSRFIFPLVDDPRTRLG